MKKFLLATSALSFMSTAAFAAGIDRAQTPLSLMFEDGNNVQLSFTSVKPVVSGKHGAAVSAANIGRDTGNMAKSENFLGLGLKMDLNEQMSFGFFMTNPYGASAEYTVGLYSKLNAGQLNAISGGTIPGVLAGSTNMRAEWESLGFEALLKYNLSERASVYGGLRAVRSSADIALPIQLVAVSARNNGVTFAGDYFAESDSPATDFGYVLGAAYEIPDIAARVAVTYRSEITHDFKVNERASNGLGATGFGSATTDMEIKMPQSLTIDFQTGIAANTLLFGSAKWTEWSKWQVEAEQYKAITGGEITGFSNDTWSYTLGVGRKMSDNTSLFTSVGYEEPKGGVAETRLAPTDGSTSLNMGGSYTFDDGTTVRAGIQTTWLGDTKVDDGALGNSKFEGNVSTAFGMSVGFKF